MSKRNIKGIAAAAGAAAAVIVGGSFAYFSQTMELPNQLSTPDYAPSVAEEFNPSQKLEPLVQISKKLTASNEGNTDLYVRVKMDEVWKRGDQVLNAVSSQDASQFLASSEDLSQTGIQGSADDGKVEGDGSVIYKKLSDSANWIFGGDGYWYYKKSLAPGENTDALLESITMVKDADMGKFEEKSAYKAGEVGLSKTQLSDDLEHTYADESGVIHWESIPQGQAETDLGQWFLLNQNGEAAAGEKEMFANDTGNKIHDLLLQKDQDGNFANTLYEFRKAYLKTGEEGYSDADYILTLTTEFSQADASAAEASGWSYYPGK